MVKNASIGLGFPPKMPLKRSCFETEDIEEIWNMHAESRWFT